VSPQVAVAVLRLVWFDPTDIASGTELMARAEAAAVLSRMGATVSWRRSSSPEVIANGEVWVTLLDAGPQADSGSRVLGATRQGPSVASVVWVRVPNVRAALGISRSLPVLALPPAERHQLGVALGRVIAHEIVHARVPSIPHGAGLMSGTITRRQLTAPSIAFEPEVAFALQAALRGDPVLASPAEPGVLTADALVQADAQVQEKDR
jgi:hypothetical protein